MCFGGGGSKSFEPTPTPAPAPVPEPAPVPTPSAPTPSAPIPTEISAQERRRKIAAIRYGMLSTIRTTPQGIVPSAGSITGNEQGNKTLGS